MAKINYNKEIGEGWTVQDMIEELEPSVRMIMNGESWQKPFRSVNELKKWVGDNQPYFKNADPDVVKHFAQEFDIPKEKGMER